MSRLSIQSCRITSVYPLGAPRREHRLDGARVVGDCSPRRHGDKLLGGCRVDRDRVVKVGLRCAHLDGDSETLEALREKMVGYLWGYIYGNDGV